MGCASSAVMPFLSEKHPKTVRVESPLNNKVDNLNGFVNNAKNVNNDFVTEKLDDAVHSSTVQNAISGVMDVKDNIAHQMHDVGEAAVNKVSSLVEDVEDKFESAFGQTKQKIDDVSMKVKDLEPETTMTTDDALQTVADNLKEIEEKEEKEKDAMIDDLLTTLQEEVSSETQQGENKKDN